MTGQFWLDGRPSNGYPMLHQAVSYRVGQRNSAPIDATVSGFQAEFSGLQVFRFLHPQTLRPRLNSQPKAVGELS